jgi:hypothetical protein
MPKHVKEHDSNGPDVGMRVCDFGAIVQQEDATFAS